MRRWIGTPGGSGLGEVFFGEGLQGVGGVLGEGVAVPEADDFGVELGDALDGAFVLAHVYRCYREREGEAGHVHEHIATEEDALLGLPVRQVTGGVAGGENGLQTVHRFEDVSIFYDAIHFDRWKRTFGNADDFPEAG